MILGRAVSDRGHESGPRGPWFASGARALCRVGVIATVVSLAPAALVAAQEGERKEAPAPAAQQAALEQAAPPAAAPEAAPAPPPAQQAAPEAATTPAPGRDTAPERREPTATAQEPAPDRAAAPAPAAPPERKSAPAPGKAAPEPDRIRGRIVKMGAASITVETREGKTVHLGLAKDLAVFSLTKASYADLSFGTYVGAVSYKLGDHIYSPIVRDSLSWLHRGFELRIIDEQLRGIALGHQKWDLTPDAVMTHGWVDDQEERVISIKFGPTEEEETDVEVPRDAPVLKMSLADRSLLKPEIRIFAGAQKDARGDYTAVFIFVGKDGIAPPL